MSEIKNYVEVSFESNPHYIHVDGESFDFEELSQDIMINPPDKREKIFTIVWDKLHPEQTCLIFSEIIDNNGNNSIFFGEEKYNDWIKPYVDLFEAEKDKQEQEQEEAEAEWNKFENRKARALTQLNADFETVKNRAHLKSILGFTIDANQTANENITGLLVTIGETETIQFCDYYNKFRELNKTQLQILQTELITNAQSLYQQKWQYRHAIEDCVDNEGLDAVLATIEFTYMDFTPTGDSETGEQA